MRRVVWLVLLVGTIGPWAASGVEEPDAQQTGRSLLDAIVSDSEFPADAQQRIRAGEIVSQALEVDGERELSLFVALQIDAPLERVFELVRSRGVLELDEKILAHGVVPEGSVDETAFAGLVLPDEELDALLDDDRQDDFNLSNQEAAGLAQVVREAEGVPEGERRKAVDVAYRGILAARVKAYRASGLSGIAPYERTNGDAFPAGKDLRAVLERSVALPKHAPTFFRALQDPPRPSTPELTQYIHWRLLDVQGRPTVVLVHGVVELDEDHGIGAVRHFYVGRFYETLQTFTAIFEHEGRALAFYANVTTTEQISGFGGSAARAIGRGLLAGEVEKLFESIRAELAGG